MITDGDLKRLKSILATKEDIQELKSRLGVLENNVKDGIRELETRIDVLEGNVTGDIAKLQNENLVTSNYRRDLDSHEERIGVIETKLAIAH